MQQHVCVKLCKNIRGGNHDHNNGSHGTVNNMPPYFLVLQDNGKINIASLLNIECTLIYMTYKK